MSQKFKVENILSIKLLFPPNWQDCHYSISAAKNLGSACGTLRLFGKVVWKLQMEIGLMQVNNLKGRVRHTQIWVRTLSVLPAVGFWAYPWIFLCQTLLYCENHHNTLELCAMWGSIFLRTVYSEQKKSTLGKLSKIVFFGKMLELDDIHENLKNQVWEWGWNDSVLGAQK